VVRHQKAKNYQAGVPLYRIMGSEAHLRPRVVHLDLHEVHSANVSYVKQRHLTIEPWRHVRPARVDIRLYHTCNVLETQGGTRVEETGVWGGGENGVRMRALPFVARTTLAALLPAHRLRRPAPRRHT
jgi:hypothetical protein